MSWVFQQPDRLICGVDVFFSGHRAGSLCVDSFITHQPAQKDFDTLRIKKPSAMKRALAERVKQEQLGSPIESPPSAPFSAKHPIEPVPSHASSSHSAPPQSVDTSSAPESKKRPRSPNAQSSGNLSTYSEPSKKRPGRPRKNASSNQAAQSDSEEEADPTSGPFFLKHQNVAPPHKITRLH